VIAGFGQGDQEIAYGFSPTLANATPAEKAELFKQMNPTAESTEEQARCVSS